MRKISENNLRKRFPKFFPDTEFVYKGETRIRPFSISVGWGWHGIIRKLCRKIEKALDTLPKDEQDKFTFFRMKEKFGGLRFHFQFQTDNKNIAEEIQRYVIEAERKSTKTCEKCGLPGKIRQDLGWWKCMCFFHYNMERMLRRAFGRDWDLCFHRTLRRVKKVLKC